MIIPDSAPLMRLAFVFWLMAGTLFSAGAQEEAEMFTIYLVRHSEKERASEDPDLTPCGVERSESLRAFFESVPLEAVYSTQYRRTLNTALPTAKAKGLEIEAYSPQALQKMAAQLLQKQQDVLVVGHSNTTGVLAGLLVQEDIGAFDESIYNRVYQVVVSESGGRLHVMHTAFQCPE